MNRGGKLFGHKVSGHFSFFHCVCFSSLVRFSVADGLVRFSAPQCDHSAQPMRSLFKSCLLFGFGRFVGNGCYYTVQRLFLDSRLYTFARYPFLDTFHIVRGLAVVLLGSPQEDNLGAFGDSTALYSTYIRTDFLVFRIYLFSLDAWLIY